jgi:hypothetical protein
MSQCWIDALRAEPAGCAGETGAAHSQSPAPIEGGRRRRINSKDKIATVTDGGGFVTEFLAYLRARKWLWLFPIVLISLLLILMAALLFGPDVALKTLYQIF